MLLLVGVVAWVGVRGWIAKGELEQAEALVGELTERAAEVDFESIGSLYTRISEHTATARTLTSDPIWRALESLPVVGSNLTAVREIAAVTDDTIIALEPIARFAGELEPAALAPVDGALPIALFDSLTPIVLDTANAVPPLRDRAAAINVEGTIDPIVAARDRITALLDRTSEPLAMAAELVPLVPRLLGEDGLRTYVVMFQNNAEARSLGGTALSFAVITIDGGRIALVETVPAGYGNFPVFDASPVPVPDGFDAIFPGAFGQFVANATLRPSFSSAAQIVTQNWLEIRGYQPDGIISVDAVALSYILRATGPIQLSTGDVLTDETVVSLLLNEVLLRYNSGDVNDDNVAQDAVYSEAVSQTFTALAGGAFDTTTLLLAMRQGFEERRFAYWDAEPETEAVFARVSLSNDLPQSTDEADAVGLFVNDNVGSKLSYYLRASVDAASGQCAGDHTVHRISMHFENLVPAGGEGLLSPSILGQFKAEGLPPGVERVLLLVYTPPGTTILGANVDGVAAGIVPLHDGDRPVARLIALVPPGATATVTIDLSMADPGDRELELTVTPMVAPTPVALYDLDCSSVTLPAGG